MLLALASLKEPWNVLPLCAVRLNEGKLQGKGNDVPLGQFGTEIKLFIVFSALLSYHQVKKVVTTPNDRADRAHGCTNNSFRTDGCQSMNEEKEIDKCEVL